MQRSNPLNRGVIRLLAILLTFGGLGLFMSVQATWADTGLYVMLAGGAVIALTSKGSRRGEGSDGDGGSEWPSGESSDGGDSGGGDGGD